jgi:hypothetical protein
LAAAAAMAVQAAALVGLVVAETLAAVAQVGVGERHLAHAASFCRLGIDAIQMGNSKGEANE